MRQFFVMTYDDREDLDTVADYEMGDFDLMTFWTGQRFSGRIPKCVRVWVEKGEPSDYLSNPIGWEIISERFWRMLRPHVKGQAQTLSVPLYYEGTQKPVPGYRLLNPLCCVSALRRKSDADAQTRKLDMQRIPDDVDLFRLAESPTTVLISDFILSEISGKGLKGLALIKTYPIKRRR
jgi:hypothetical protein